LKHLSAEGSGTCLDQNENETRNQRQAQHTHCFLGLYKWSIAIATACKSKARGHGTTIPTTSDSQQEYSDPIDPKHQPAEVPIMPAPTPLLERRSLKSSHHHPSSPPPPPPSCHHQAFTLTPSPHTHLFVNTSLCYTQEGA